MVDRVAKTDGMSGSRKADVDLGAAPIQALCHASSSWAPLASRRRVRRWETDTGLVATYANTPVLYMLSKVLPSVDISFPYV